MKNTDQVFQFSVPDGNSVDHFPVLAATQGSCSSHHRHQLGDDEVMMMMMMAATSPDGNMVSAAQGGGDQQLPQNNIGSSSQNPSHGWDTTKKRKSIHRDVERQRRQDMASLYGSLRSHLPLQLLKGKRSISDHIHESVRYIKHLQNRIQELNDLRDNQKRSLEPLDNTNATAASPVTNLQNSYGDSTVMVKPCMAGVEVTIHTDLRRGIPLSKVLGFLGKEGISVIFWTSTRVKERVLYSIKSEVNDRRKNYNLCDLQRRIMNLVG